MQNHPDGDSRNPVWETRIPGNCSCRPTPCIELLEYNGIYVMFFFPYEKNDAGMNVHCDHDLPKRCYRRRHPDDFTCNYLLRV